VALALKNTRVVLVALALKNTRVVLVALASCGVAESISCAPKGQSTLAQGNALGPKGNALGLDWEKRPEP